MIQTPALTGGGSLGHNQSQVSLIIIVSKLLCWCRLHVRTDKSSDLDGEHEMRGLIHVIVIMIRLGIKTSRHAARCRRLFGF